MQIQSPVLKALGAVIAVLFTSFYFFPVEFVFLPANTKKLMAAVGIALFIYDAIRRRSQLTFERNFVFAILLAVGVSVMSYATMAANNTLDREFVGYVVSLFVWIGGAYTTVHIIKLVHGRVSLELTADYLIAVCVFQCILAYWISASPVLATFINSIVSSTAAFMGGSNIQDAGRLYGLGCALDPSGLRMAGVEIIILMMALKRGQECSALRLALYFVAFMIIAIFGNMISRSTTVGILIGLAFAAAYSFIHNGRLYVTNGRFWKLFLGALAIAITSGVIAYNLDDAFAEHLEFGFEGFFSLFRSGVWNVGSNEMLVNMVVWPDNLRTWLIGDGYMGNPWEDLNYIGVQFGGGYYMGTDIGYCRYIFYFGIIGLAGLMLMFAFMTVSLCKAFPEYKWMFVLLLVSNYAGWAKVTSDIVMIFAIFLVTAFLQTPEEDLPESV